MIEFASSVPTLLAGQTFPQIADRVDAETNRHPLAVCAGITRYNFPNVNRHHCWRASTDGLATVYRLQRVVLWRPAHLGNRGSPTLLPSKDHPYPRWFESDQDSHRNPIWKQG